MITRRGFLAATGVACAAPGAADELAKGFADPPFEARPSAYWVWLNGVTEAARITFEIEQMKRAGFNALYILEIGTRSKQVPAGPAYLGPESLEAIRHAVREATRLGLELGITNASSWNSGGAWVGPDYAGKGLYWSRTPVAGPARFDAVLATPEPPPDAPRRPDGSPAWMAEVAVLAIPDSAPNGQAEPPVLRSIVDLSDRLESTGRLRWDAPPGRWTILRFVAANTGQRLVLPSPLSAGLIIDHYDPEATRRHTEHILESLHSVLGEFRRTALKCFYACSYEVKGSLWTPRLPDEFRRRRGYDLKPFLAVLAGAAVGDPEPRERFLVDFRRTVAELFTEGFYQTTRSIVNRHGLKLVAEAGGPGWPRHQVPVDALKAQASVDIPRGEFWKQHDIWVVKETAAAAHVYGKNLVQMEAFTSFRHWQDAPRDLKDIADRAFCDGANHMVWHTMPHGPSQAGQPGWVYHAGTHVGPNETWWPMASPFFDYLARCSFLLQQGLFVADVCYYYGEQGFNFVREKPVEPALGFGFDYDAANSEVILTRLRVRDGRLVLPDGMRYELLALPALPGMDLEVLARLEQLVRAGAAIAGPRPTRASGLRDYPACDEKVRRLAGLLWSGCDGRRVTHRRYGKGQVFWGVPLREVLRRRGVRPDFQYTARRGAPELDFIHRRTAACDLYFVANRKPEWAEVECRFRVKGRSPEIWNPVTGETGLVPEHAAAPEGTRVALALPPFGSVFVVFGARGRRRPGAPEREVRSIDVSGPWEVRFPAGWGAPPSKTLSKLNSWTDDPDPGVRYFSGIATYLKRLDLPAACFGPNLRLHLDLGDVRSIARATLNGQPLGVVWTEPFRWDVTAAARPGVNELEVEVANTWSNRLTGDANTTGRRFTRTNIAWKKDTPLLPSGLLGPVRVVVTQGGHQRGSAR